ncbi:unnamed protein product [Rhodiola kirilowii]
MATSFRTPEYPRGFMTSLASAFLEWLLMFLLFSNGVFSYLITKFARYCNLPLPCLLCSRLDNILGSQKVDYFQDLFCRNHKTDISSLVLCHAHCKLVDVHNLCETCLFSFATINKSNSETYRLLVGKLGDDPEAELEQGPLIEGNKHVNTRRCSCCNELWCPKGYPHDLLRTCSIDHEALHLDIPLSRDIAPDSFQHNQRSRQVGDASDGTHMYHVGYMELKVTSDTESEVLISEYESTTAHFEINDHKLDELKPRIIRLVDDSASEKLIHPSSEPEPSMLVAHQPDNVVTISSLAPDSNVSMHGLEELNWHHVEPEAHSDSQAELISFDDLHVADVCETVFEDVKESVDRVERSEVMQTSLASVLEDQKEMSEAVSESHSESKNDTDLQSSKSLDFGDAYNIAISNKGRQTSGSFGERNINNSAKISEDLKQLLSQISRGTDLPSFDMSPRVSRNLEELKLSDSSCTGMQMLQKRISLERNESGLESLDGSVSEVEGESLVDRLKRQIEHDKKLLLTLYKELEEERSASAIAANQAMAMITRLQEEKAALHMDASQYLRMMEEQAEYDMEALQNCNDLLTEREIEIQTLEAELEHYRSKYPDEAALMAKVEPSYDLTEKDIKVDQSEARSFEDRSFSRSFKNVEGLRTSFRDQMKSSFLERENGRMFVSDLSNKLKELAENEVDSTNGNDDHSMHREETELHIEELNYDEDLTEGGELDNSPSSNQKQGSTCKRILHAAENNEDNVVSSEKQVPGLDVNHDAIAAGKSSPNSPANQHKGWHIVQEIDLEEDKGKGVEC